MKKSFNILSKLAIVLAVIITTMFSGSPAKAADEYSWIDDYSYSIQDSTVTLEQYVGREQSADLVVYPTAVIDGNTYNVSVSYYVYYGCNNINSVEFLDDVEIASGECLFKECDNLKKVVFGKVDSSKMYWMYDMFMDCPSLQELDLRNLDTSNVEDLSRAFFGCSSLKSLDLSSFNTGKVVYMNDLFNGCNSLINVNLSSFDTSKVTDMSAMFCDCVSLAYLDLSLFDTSLVTDMHWMFLGCEALTNVEFGAFNTGNVKNMSNMFWGCISLLSLDLSTFNTARVTNMENMFSNCQKLLELDLRTFDTHLAKNRMQGMFSSCYNLRTVYASDKWTTSFDPDDLFGSCPKLEGEDGGYLTYSKVVCPRITKLKNGGTDAGIAVSFEDPEDSKDYEIWRSNEGDYWDVVSSGITSLSCTDNTADVMGEVYYYKLRGAKHGDMTEFSIIKGVVRNPFTDVLLGTDTFTHVAWAYNNGIVGGTSKTTYSPEKFCTRAQFCIMLYKMAGMPNVSISNLPFSDIADQTKNTKKAIVWCARQGIVGGKNGKFNPKGNITKSQLLIMLYKMAGTPDVSGLDCPFTDLASQTSNTRNAIIWAYNIHLIDSITGDRFEPTAKGTRALLTEMLYGYSHIENE